MFYWFQLPVLLVHATKITNPLLHTFWSIKINFFYDWHRWNISKSVHEVNCDVDSLRRVFCAKNVLGDWLNQMNFKYHKYIYMFSKKILARTPYTFSWLALIPRHRKDIGGSRNCFSAISNTLIYLCWRFTTKLSFRLSRTFWKNPSPFLVHMAYRCPDKRIDK